MTSTKTGNKSTSKSTPQPAATQPEAAAAPWFDQGDVDYLDLMKKFGDAWIQALAENQEATLAATKASIENFKNQVGDTPPAVATFPQAKEIVDAHFAFADKYLANQKEFAVKLLELHDA